MPKEKRKKAPRGRRKKTAPQLAARFLIGAGLVLMLFAGIYEAANYPWQVYFRPADDFKSYTALPDPTPPSFAPDAADPPAPELPGAPEETGAPEDLTLPDESLSQFIDAADTSVRQTVLGIIKLPKLGVSVNIIAGAKQSQLIWGAGHVTGSPMSGQPGNVCIAGHRVTARMHPFRHLEMMAPGDYVFVQYQEHVYTYETLETFVISNTDVSVMRAVPGEPHLLTLITCHPPGSARERLILRGRLILVDDRPPEEFFSPPTPETTPDASTPSDAPESPNAAETPPDISPPGSGEEAPVSTEPSVPADEPPPDGSPLPGAEPAPESNAPDTENAAAIEPSPPDLSGN